jgi:trans-aconitate methyltransferase
VSDNEWDSDQYDDSHDFVYEYGGDVVDLLGPQPDEQILDLGCGTGHLTAEIADRAESVVGIDAAAEMVAQAREQYPDLDFRQADAREFEASGFDAVFSNAALHWIPGADHGAVLGGVRAALGDDGRFVAEMGGRGNVDQIVTATLAELDERGYEAENPWYFPSIGEYASRLESHGFEVTRAVLFERPTALEDGADGLSNWLGMFGDQFFADVTEREREEIVAAVEDRLRPTLFDAETETWTADYRRLRFVTECV